MKILVTGATGTVGGHVVRYLTGREPRTFRDWADEKFHTARPRLAPTNWRSS